MREIEEEKDIIIIDTRGDREWNNGHIPGAKHISWIDFRIDSRPRHSDLLRMVMKNREKKWVFYSQGYPGSKDASARGWLAAADLRLFHKIENVRYLGGGWIEFNRLYPGYIEREGD